MLLVAGFLVRIGHDILVGSTRKSFDYAFSYYKIDLIIRYNFSPTAVLKTTALIAALGSELYIPAITGTTC